MRMWQHLHVCLCEWSSKQCAKGGRELPPVYDDDADNTGYVNTKQTTVLHLFACVVYTSAQQTT
jgi:hypothetical protein